MRDYGKYIINHLPIKLDENDTAATSENKNVSKNDNSKMLSKDKAEIFHTITEKCLFLCKREVPDI